MRNTLSSREETERMVRDCERIGCSLLFLQVSGRWDAYFPSQTFPRGQFWDSAEGDNLRRAIELAHERGIRVHAWVNALLGWAADEPPRDPEHVFHRHPEWFLVGHDGRSIVELSRGELDRRRLEGYFLEPRIPEVRSELRRFVLELVTRYALDGVHLDYIRFPSPAWGFQPELRRRYRDDVGLDPRDLFLRERELAAERGAGWLAQARDDWQEWHRAGVTQLVRLIAGDLRDVRPDLELSAAVLANPASARDDFGQDWAGWLEEGILDLAAPMVYRASAGQVLDLLQTIHRRVPEGRVYAGVSLEFLGAREIPTIEGLMERYGSDGLAIFSYNLLRGDARALQALEGR
ncbi:MAG: glycoside hydrolase family 10 protein [Gemmatimonadota bacterium]